MIEVQRKTRERGAAMVLTFVVLVLLSGLMTGLLEVSMASSELQEAVGKDIEAGLIAEDGLSYYIHQLSVMNLQGKTSAEAQAFLENEVAGGTRRFFSNSNGWFQLEKVLPTGKDYFFQVEITGSAHLPNQSASLDSFIDEAYADSASHHILHFEAVVGPKMDNLNGVGIYSTEPVEMTGGGATLSSYPGSGRVIAPELQMASTATVTNTKYLEGKIHDEVKEVVAARLQDARTLLNGVTYFPSATSLSSYTSDTTSTKNYFIPAGNIDFRSNFSAFTVSGDNDTLAVGDPNTFSRMKFNDLLVKGAYGKIIFHQGVYEMDDFKVNGDYGRVYFDTTKGPVYLIIKGQIQINGPSGLMYNTKNTYTDAVTDYTLYENLVDSDGKTDIATDGQKVVEIFLDGGQMQINGNDATGSVKLATGYSSNTGMPTGITTSYDVAAPPAENMKIWGVGNNNIQINGDSSGFMATIIAPDYQFQLNGDDAVLHGAVVARQMQMNGNNVSYNIDTRAIKLPPIPVPGTMHVIYIRRMY